MKPETILSNLAKIGKTEGIHGASHFPIYQTATFDFQKQPEGVLFGYSRIDNPTREHLEQVLTQLEDGAFGTICTSSGVEALVLLFDTTLKAHSKILVEQDLYGGTFQILNHIADQYQIQVDYIDMADHKVLEEKLKCGDISLVHFESPTNPGLKILDIKYIADISHRYGAKCSIDNSVATFLSQQALTLGVDFTVSSATKYMSGHGAVIAGTFAAIEEQDFIKAKYLSGISGKAQSPIELFMMSLGMPTMALRMERHQENALLLANYFETRPEVKNVIFPGLKSHPQHKLAKQQMRYMPGILLVHFNTCADAERVIANTKWFGEKASFGTVDSRMEMPIKISHASFSEQELAKVGIFPSSVRVSVGIENIDDLITDIDNALK